MSEEKSVVAAINEVRKEIMTQLAPGRVMLAEHARNVWCATPETGTPIETLLDHKYWAHYAVNQSFSVKPGDRIEVYAEDGTYFVELIVRDVSRAGLRVASLRAVKFDDGEQKGEDFGDFEVKWQGQRYKFAVIRKSDKQRVSEGHQQKDQAIDWLREHLKAFAA